MAYPRVPESELTPQDKAGRDRLLEYFRRTSDVVVTHYVIERSVTGKSERDLIAVLKDRNKRSLVLFGCRLGGAPEHEGGASLLGSYEEVLANLGSRSWSPAQQSAIRAFITGNAEVEPPKPRRGRRSGKTKKG